MGSCCSKSQISDANEVYRHQAHAPVFPKPHSYNLPQGWVCRYDKEVSRLFYVNTSTKKSQWNHPYGVEAWESDSSQFRDQLDAYERSLAKYNQTHGVNNNNNNTIAEVIPEPSAGNRMSEQYSKGQNPLDNDDTKGRTSTTVEPSGGGLSTVEIELSNMNQFESIKPSKSPFTLGNDDDDHDYDDRPVTFGYGNYKSNDYCSENRGVYDEENDFVEGTGVNSIDHNNNSEGKFVGGGRDNNSKSLDLSDSRDGYRNYFKGQAAKDEYYSSGINGW
ncbi:hypothetical protein BGZ76_010989 [Entomortierella beljakovae]|nr:hypothetical protein BGZ76_010989 [Entomortierella beljakovae]